MTGKQNRILLIFILALTIAASFVTFSPKVKTLYGLDIKGGVRVVLRAKTEQYKGAWKPENLETMRNIMERRVNGSGVSEPVVVTKQPDQIIIELPGLTDETEVLDRLKSTANLQFYWLAQLGNKAGTRPKIWSVTEVHDPKTGVDQDVIIDDATGKPVTPEILQDQVFDKDPLVSGKDLLPNCSATINPNGSTVINFEFNDEGGRTFEDFTRVPSHLGDYLAIFLDNKLLTAPSINGVIPGKGIIEGHFTAESAKALAAQLNAGALPVPLEILEQRKLEATLGEEAVQATKIAGGVGLALVLLFMMVYYRLPGVLANLALVLYTIFSVALFKLYPVTLTLPGIAGFILSIGMAVDANILIFERLKEELNNHKTLRNAIDVGFKRAFTAIFDSNVCTIMTCCVLYYFGTGPIRGFALTLGLGVVVSMFTAITVTRTFLFTLLNFGFAQKESLYGLRIHWTPNLRVMARKWMWLGLSGVVIIPGLIAWSMGGIKRSIDFQGGTELDLPFAKAHTVADIQAAMVRVSPTYKDSRVVVSNDEHSKTAYVTTVHLEAPARAQLIQSLIQNVGPLTNNAGPNDVAYSNVSGTISAELTSDAIKAVIIASILIVLYLAIRFAIGGLTEGLKYGTCAVIALLHDVLVVWGAFALLGLLFGWQIDSLFVTAMLTVIGFSVHDTIIIFDRMRENLQIRQKGETFTELADRSITQTIARSVNTSFTVVLTLLALFFFGGSIIHQFIGALLIGIISGTYSSIFNASVLLVMWKQKDASLAAASGPALTAKSGLVPRPAKPLPGDRPVIAPRPGSDTNRTDAPQAESSAGGVSDSSGGVSRSDSPRAPRTAGPQRRAPQRRRRM